MQRLYPTHDCKWTSSNSNEFDESFQWFTYKTFQWFTYVLNDTDAAFTHAVRSNSSNTAMTHNS